jgi:hypothetical protein
MMGFMAGGILIRHFITQDHEGAFLNCFSIPQTSESSASLGGHTNENWKRER